MSVISDTVIFWYELNLLLHVMACHLKDEQFLVGFRLGMTFTIFSLTAYASVGDVNKVAGKKNKPNISIIAVSVF